MKAFTISLVLLFSISLCSQNKFKQGIWRGVLTLSETKNEIVLPFNFMVSYPNKKPLIVIQNAEEKIKVTEIEIKGDSVNFKMPVFDSEFKTVLRKDTLRGSWTNHSKKEKNRIEFEAYYNDKRRFAGDKKAGADLSGKYSVIFNAGGSDEYPAIGIFKQTGNKITGTFLTETGDYRYLEGVVQQDNMALSCFDGAHAFLFYANSTKDSLTGKAFYGISGIEDWKAKKDPNAKLKDAETITLLKDPNEKVKFSFPDAEKKMVGPDDEKFRNKALIIQIMGSWCPNCMDETAYLATLYKQYKSKGLEIIALAYERTDDFEKAKKNITRLKNKFGADYDILITGLTGKEKASESLPFLNQVSAFPTTIILDKDHKVRSIYTGFSGPATGIEYEKYKIKTENLINELLKK